MEIMEITKTRGIPSQRTNRLKEQLFESPFDIDLERIRAYTKVWKEMGSQGDRVPCMRAARAFAETLRNIGIFIGESERFVGTRGPGLRYEVFGVERCAYSSSYDLVVQNMVPGVHVKRASEKCRDELEKNLLPFWDGKTQSDYCAKQCKEEGLLKRNRPMGPVGTYRLFKGLGGLNGSPELIRKSLTAGAELLESDLFRALADLMGEGGDSKESAGRPSLREYGSKIAAVAKQLTIRNLVWALKTGRGGAKFMADQIPDRLWLVRCQQGHLIPGFPRVLELGFAGIAERARLGLQQLEESDTDYDRRNDFLESVIVSADAVGEYSRRYADLAERKAADATSPERKAELLATAEWCRRVPMRPPETFMEALQSILMTQTVMNISYGGDNIFTPGRVDQYIYPYYQKDIESGRITREQALEAVEEYMVKISGNGIFGPNHVTIGGLDKQGNDVTNEVSYLFLEALENIRGMGDGLAVRISHKTPREFLLRACEVNQFTAGAGFYNDDIIVGELVADGYSLEDARNYSVIGCVELAGTGDSYSPTALNGFWLAGVLEMALNQGRRLFTGTRTVGVRTPDPRQFRSFEDVKDAFEKQLAFTVEKGVLMKEVSDKVFADFFPDPVLSATIEGCLESGQDATRGGARYNHGCVNAQGLGTVSNGLAAIKWAVFDEKIVTMDELLDAMANNFKGYESLHQTLLKKAPKYGNDDPGADEIAAWVSEVFTREGRKYTSFRGDRYRCSMVSSATQVIEGLFCGALPDGRLAFEAISNSMSPSNGTEQNGATAVLHSAASGGTAGGRANYSLGTALNMRLNPAAIKSEESIDKLASLLEAYFVMGGRQVAFSPLDAETLRDAQAHPEKYPDLTVKVSGYSARFAELVKELQDDIIARTEFDRL
jgi:formate C-acetyltransferase